MHYHITKTHTHSIASITRPAERMVVIQISADIHEGNSARIQAISQFYAEALVSGCGRYDRTAFHEAINLLGAEIQVRVDDNVFNVYIKTISEHAEKVLDIFACMIENPTFSQREFPRIRSLRVNRLREKREEAKIIAHEKLINQIYDKNDRRYTYTIEEIVAETKKVTRNDLQNLHAKIRKSFWCCTIGSNEKVLRLLKKTVLNITTDGSTNTHIKKHAQKPLKRRIVLESIPSKENIEFSIGGPLPLTLHHPDYLPFVFGLSVLGKWGGFTGRLMSTVREKEGLTYGIYARTETVTGTEFGYWRIMTFFSPAKSEQGIRSTLREIKLITEYGITDDEFLRFKIILKTQQDLLADSFLHSLFDLHQYHFAGFSLHEIEEYKRLLSSVSKDEINLALKKYLDADKLIVSGAGPIQDVKKKLCTLK